MEREKKGESDVWIWKGNEGIREGEGREKVNGEEWGKRDNKK